MEKHRGRYEINPVEGEALIDVGRFRTIEFADLVRYVFAGDRWGCKKAIARLRRIGFVNEYHPLERPEKSFVTLTDRGRQWVVDALTESGSDQQVYAGLVQRRQIDHDSALYRVFHRAIREAANGELNVLRIELDFELKATLMRKREALRAAGLGTDSAALERVANQLGLTLVGTRIPLPDVRMVYRTGMGGEGTLDLEYLTGWSRKNLELKVQAGFELYGSDRAPVPDFRGLRWRSRPAQVVARV